MAFDPDEYLASGDVPEVGGFDPDAYLADKPTAPFRSAGPYREGYQLKPSYPPLLPPLGAVKAIANDEALRRIGGPRSIEYDKYGFEVKPAGPSGPTVSDAVGGAFTDTFAFGALGKALDLLPDEAAHYLGGTRAEREAWRNASPVGDVLGKTIGAGASGVAGPEALIARGVEASIPAAGSALMTVARSALSGGAQGGIAGATQAAGEGASPRETALAALRGTVFGAGLNGGMSAVGQGAGAVSRALRRDRWIGEYANARESGAYQEPQQTTLARGEEGIRQAADRAQTGIATRNAERLQTAGRAHGDAIDAALEAQPMHDVAPVTQRLMGIAQGNRTARSGVVRDQRLEQAINDAFDLMDIDPQTGQAMGRDLIAARRTLNERAQWGQPSSAENAPYRQIYGAFNEGLKGQPGSARTPSQSALAMADEAYAAQRTLSERLNDVLAGSEEGNISRGVRDDGTPDIRAPKERQAAARLARVGDRTVAGGVEARQMAEIPPMDPVYARLLETIRQKKALELTRPGPSRGHSSLPSMLQFPGAPLVEQNLRFIGARALDPAANAVGNTLGQGAPGLLAPVLGMDPINQLVAMARAQAAKDEETNRRAAEYLTGRQYQEKGPK